MRTIFLILLLFTAYATVFAQKVPKATFSDVMVVSFEAPFQSIAIDANGEEIVMAVNTDCAFLNKRKKAIAPESITSASLIDLEYTIMNGQRTVLEIVSNINEDGIVSLSGVFEGLEDQQTAYIDGHRVSLAPNTIIIGGKGDKCGCKSYLFPSFSDQLLNPGRYFMDVEGKVNEAGVLEATEATVCKNDYIEADRLLREAVDNSYTSSGLSQVNKPANFPIEVGLPLHNGNIVIGNYSYKLHDNLMLQGYVNSIGERLVPEYQRNMPDGDANKIDFRFYVIDDPIPNAFAFPNGMIFVHTGILDIMDNEAELAVVLGHEIAHVTHEHGRERYEGGVKGQLVQDLLNRFMGETVSKYTQNLGLSSSLEASIKQSFGALRPAALVNVFNPQPARESQADRVGLQYALLAGYDIREAVVFWNKMKNLTGDPSFKSQMTSHITTMLTSNSINRNETIVNQLGAAGIGALSTILLDNIYSSHPKSKARAIALNQMINTTYASENYDRLRKREDDFRRYVKDILR